MVTPTVGTDLAATRVYLGLGSNLGDRLDHLRRALFALAAHPQLVLRRVSRVFESRFVGQGQQPDFLNLCALVETGLSPSVLLSVCQAVELRHGRLTQGHMLPRPLDIDILLYGNRVVDQLDLQIPHPQAAVRGFVLEPLLEIGSAEVFPNSGETIAAACAKIRRKSGPWVRLREDLVLAENSYAVNKEDWRAALAVHCR